MLFRVSIVLFALWFAARSDGQQRFPLEDLGHVGQLGTEFDRRTVVDWGFARARLAEDRLILEGDDDAGAPWLVSMPYEKGIGFTRVFAGDVDANGRRDLLVAGLFPSNGRCIEGGWVTAVLFDGGGRPVPWGARTHGVLSNTEHPLVLLDQDGNGRAELAVHDCTHSAPPRFGEDRWIEGVFEPEDGIWKPIEPPTVLPYLQSAQTLYQDANPGYIDWIERPQRGAPMDVHAGWEADRRVEVHGRLLARFGCKRGPGAPVYLPCEPRRPLGLRYGDGRTRSGTPTVVLDSDAGREVYVEPNGAVLDRLVAAGGSVRATGAEDQPAMLWARRSTFPDAPELSVRVTESSRRRTPVRVLNEEQAARRQAEAAPQAESQKPASDYGGYAGFLFGATGGGGDTGISNVLGPSSSRVFSRGGRCFRMEPSTAELLQVTALGDCRALGRLANEAASGARTMRDGFNLSPAFFRPGDPTLYRQRGPVGAEPLKTPLDPPNGRPADVFTAVEAPGIGAVSQWSLGGSTWIVLQRFQAAEILVEGELLQADAGKGLVFLRWEGGVPVERIELAVEVEVAKDK